MESSEPRRSLSPPRAWRKIAIAVIFSATFVAFIYSVRNLIGAISAGRRIDWAWTVYYEFLYWYIWAAFTPLILWFAGRFEPERFGWKRTALIMLAFGLFVAPVQAGVENALALLGERIRLVPEADIKRRVQQLPISILLETFTNFIIYLLIAAAFYGYRYYQKYRERQLRSVELEGRLAQAELENLKSQLQPHFLFNTLNAISVLMMRDPENANRMLVRLSDLLRLSLDQAHTQEIALKQELEFLVKYLEIERTRFHDRLTFDTDIDPVTLDAAVPNLILQPLVENAVRHGIGKKTNDGRIRIRARREGSSLCLEVEDNGLGLKVASVKEGVGLRNSRARLERLYGSHQRFVLSNTSGGGVLVAVVIPFRVYESVE